PPSVGIIITMLSRNYEVSENLPPVLPFSRRKHLVAIHRIFDQIASSYIGQANAAHERKASPLMSLFCEFSAAERTASFVCVLRHVKQFVLKPIIRVGDMPALRNYSRLLTQQLSIISSYSLMRSDHPYDRKANISDKYIVAPDQLEITENLSKLL